MECNFRYRSSKNLCPYFYFSSIFHISIVFIKCNDCIIIGFHPILIHHLVYHHRIVILRCLLASLIDKTSVFLVLQSVLFHFLSVFCLLWYYHLLKFQGLHLSLTNLCGLSFQAGNIRMIRIVNYNKKISFPNRSAAVIPATRYFPFPCVLLPS